MTGERSNKVNGGRMEDTAIRSRFQFDYRVETQYPHCVLPPNFFDRMLAKVSGRHLSEREEQQSPNITRAPRTPGH